MGQKILLSVPSKYTCQFCKEEKPLDSDNFQTVKSFKSGYSTVCLECSKPKQRDEKEKK
jgi:hypothetical protein